ncbi:hypothetical protein CEE36_01525 [candidate division TA06 bacterium B3_TA06]|uniref:Uncharacterized protein n=1 Tax=candidate division TA06 bacterium B3_TA06 TaxID=2012487 RepID=A0A532V9D2_UNCT6|nr:MAG: hypothetical protein CEE36_01525 [candidate division TA06 bacterium B3_TA06]
MKRKILTPVVLAVALLLVASAVWAESNWEGTFCEIDPSQFPGISGTWKGTFHTITTPSTFPYFLGTWDSDGHSGACGGIALLGTAAGDYCVVNGWAEVDGDTLYDCWKGSFNEKTGLAHGTWKTELYYGEWEGRMLE